MYHIYVMDLKNKKVLQMGLGILGGGVATARFLVEQGTILTVTDMKTAEYLQTSLDKLADISNKINFVLGEHREEDFLDNEIIVLNPDVSLANPLVQTAIKAGKQIETELTLFFRYVECRSVIGITGTRGKTTTTLWTGSKSASAGRRWASFRSAGWTPTFFAFGTGTTSPKSKTPGGPNGCCIT
jgi:UDP-N-acetylmuramoylalanine--D-glutamate ligase